MATPVQPLGTSKTKSREQRELEALESIAWTLKVWLPFIGSAIFFLAAIVRME